MNIVSVTHQSNRPGLYIDPCLSLFFFYCHAGHRHLYSFPTRRSSDLVELAMGDERIEVALPVGVEGGRQRLVVGHGDKTLPADRKSTRLNSSHGYISYAVFCLKKKKEKIHLSLVCFTASQHRRTLTKM